MSTELVLLILLALIQVFKPETIKDRDSFGKVFFLIVLSLAYTGTITILSMDARLTAKLIGLGYFFDALAVFYFGRALLKSKIEN